MNTPQSAAPRAEILVVAGAFFLEVLDATIMTPALVVMSVALETSISAVAIALAVYVLALVLFTPLIAQINPTACLKKRFLLGLSIFAVGSLLCAVSQDVYQLAGARCLQGLGSAALVPAGRALVLARTARALIPATMAWLVWPALLAPVFGLVLGGHLVDHLGWRAIFWTMLPLGTALFVIAAKVLQTVETVKEEAQRPFDWASYGCWSAFSLLLFAAFVTAIAQLVYLALLMLGLAALAGYVMVATLRGRGAHALFDMSMLRLPSFRLNLISGSVFRIAIYAFPVVLSLYLIQVAGYSPAQVGNCLVFIFIGNLLAKPVAVWVLTRVHNVRLFFVVAGGATAMTLGAFLLPAAYDSSMRIAFLCLLHGFARSFQFLGYSSTAFYDIEPARMLPANVFTASVMQINAMLGQALPALLAVLLTFNLVHSNGGQLFLIAGVGLACFMAFCTTLTALFIQRVPQ